MCDNEEKIIAHLREMLAETQRKLKARDMLLAQVLPHVETLSNTEDAHYIWFEIVEKYGSEIEEFKKEYGSSYSV